MLDLIGKVKPDSKFQIPKLLHFQFLSTFIHNIINFRFNKNSLLSFFLFWFIQEYGMTRCVHPNK